MVKIKGMTATRVNNPKSTKIEQKNSAKIVPCNDKAGPKPKGSANRLRYSLKLAILGQPCVTIIKEDATRKSNKAASIAYIRVENKRRFIYYPLIWSQFIKD